MKFEKKFRNKVKELEMAEAKHYHAIEHLAAIVKEADTDIADMKSDMDRGFDEHFDLCARYEEQNSSYRHLAWFCLLSVIYNVLQATL